MNRKMIWNDGLDSWTEEELLCMKYLNVCYGKGGGSAPPPPPTTSSQTTTSEFPTELRPFISDIFEKSQAIQEQRQEEGFQPELTQQLASFTPEQLASFQGIQNVVGQTQPLFDEATTLARQSGRAATDPAEVAALMNPFLRNVTDIQKREAQRVGDVQEQQLAAQASQAGAFGGSRAAILEAERQRNLSQQLGDIEAQGLAASFQNAQNQLQNQFGRESAAAAQLGALGAAIPAQQFKEFGALSGIGAAKQQQAQRAFDIATQQAREEYGFPMATLQDFSSILRGFPLPATQNVSRQSFSPAQPLSTQLLGLGTGLAGLAGAAGAFKKAGGLVGAPVGMKNGGYVKLAGGGGLGQMMQEKLPSNRVRLGKTAYQDVTVPIPRGTLFEMSEEIQNILDDEGPAGLAKIQKNYPRNVINFALDQYQQNLPAGNPLKNLLDESKQLITDADRALGTPRVAGEIATAAAEKASVPDSAAAIPAPKMATKIDSRVPFIQASLNSDGTVAAPPAPPALVTATPVGGSTDSATVPVNMAGMDPTAAAAIPEAGLLQRGQQNYPYKIDAPLTQYTSPQNPAEGLLAPEGLKSPSLMSRLFTAPKLNFDVDPLKSSPPGSDLMIRQSEADKKFSPDVLTKMYGEGGEDFLTERFTGTGTPLLSAAPNQAMLDINKAREQVKLEQNSNELNQPAAELISEVPKTDAAPTSTAPADLDANNIDMDIQRNPDLSSSQGMTQNSYSKFLKDFREGQNKDYSAEVEKAMGPAPTYEKGEEPDFAARKWLALANFGAGIAASGGGKTLAQSIGEAAKPALKELADIGKEERKIKRELRTERNAQKRMKYQDKLQRFDLQRKLRSDDLDSIKAFADIKLKQDRNDISREDASVRRIQAMSTKAMNDTKIAILDLNSTMDAKGQVFIKDVMAKLDDLRKIGMKSSVSNSMYGVDAKTATAAYQAQLPSVYQQFRGRVLKDGKIMTDGELASLLKVGPTTQPGTTVSVPNSNATITMGNVSN